MDRDDIKVLNCSIIFDVLPYKSSSYLFKSLKPIGNKESTSELRILVGTKGCELSFFLSLLKVLSKRKSKINSDISLLVFQRLRNRIIIDTFLLFGKLLKLKPVNVTYLSKMPPHLYTATVASCNTVLLQDRGGASTARLFCKWGRGTVLLRKNSPNYFFFKDVYNIDFLSFDCIEEIEKVLNSNIVDVKKNSYNVLSEERRAIDVFRSIYG